MQEIKKLITIFLPAIACALLVLQCATPTQPSGGPRDTTPPEVEETEPAPETTLFEGDRVRFKFSKYMDRDSFMDAFQMEPDLNLDFEISWSRRTATVRFDEPLPDTTTVIFTLGADLRDTRNNNLAAPYQLALSTGPDIDQGRITATVRDAETGEGLMGERVVLYRYPYDLSTGADYVGEADSAGVVRFNYLREGSYKAFWLDDRNRNRRWDRPREDAQPFRTDSLVLDHDGEADSGTVFVISEDTIPPVLHAVGMLSEVRLRLRFSEEITFGDNSVLDIFHDDGTWLTEAVPLYVDPDNSNVLFAQAREPLPDGEEYRIEMQGITDPAENVAEMDVELFPGSDEPDTTFARYIGNDTRHGIVPDEPIVIRYAKLLDNEPDVLDSLIVIETQTTHAPWPHAEVSDNLLFIYPDGEWRQSEDYEIRVWDDEELEHRTIRPVIHYENELGELHITVEEPETDTTRHQLELVNEQGELVRSESFLDEIELSGIPAGDYVLRVFELREGTRSWDRGSVDPFRAPARYFVQEEVPVQPGMTGQLYVEWE